MVYRTYVYLRASPQAVRQIREGMEAFQERHSYVTSKPNVQRLVLTPISEIHLWGGGRQMKAAGDPKMLQALSLIGLLIVVVAAINYINLMTARASRRAVEVGIRKVAGASRTDLTLQFIGESLIYSGLAMLLACMLTELLLPTLNAFLDSNISFEWSVPRVASLLGATVFIGTLAGIYPALVLSAFKPATVLKGGVVQGPGAGTLRQLFVLLQFAILIGLTLAATIIHRQTAFGLRSRTAFRPRPDAVDNGAGRGGILQAIGVFGWRSSAAWCARRRVFEQLSAELRHADVSRTRWSRGDAEKRLHRTRALRAAGVETRGGALLSCKRGGCPSV
jgi:putative ABC transport system permease protein